ncbi:glycosyltransferase, partial [Arthrospira platensis SPKY1]|nr:glycosyltransferase [Arthrospira platensis SPKY1]
GEYLAAGRPVITTAYGEILRYDFVDGETALVADSYDEENFARKMQFVADHPEKAGEIGRRGREMGLTHFDFRKVGRQLYDFLGELQERPVRQMSRTT